MIEERIGPLTHIFCAAQADQLQMVLALIENKRHLTSGLPLQRVGEERRH